jgi:hypothetical protein
LTLPRSVRTVISKRRLLNHAEETSSSLTQVISHDGLVMQKRFFIGG